MEVFIYGVLDPVILLVFSMLVEQRACYCFRLWCAIRCLAAPAIHPAACVCYRAFASRVYPPDIVERLGIKHVRGMLLHGPPGTGKTLIARQIGRILNANEPKIVNGPEVLNKYVGRWPL